MTGIRIAARCLFFVALIATIGSSCAYVVDLVRYDLERPIPDPIDPVVIPPETNVVEDVQDVPEDPAPRIIDVDIHGYYMIEGRAEWIPYADLITCTAGGAVAKRFGTRNGRPAWVSRKRGTVVFSYGAHTETIEP